MVPSPAGLTLPPDVPAKNFWSVVVYDPQTRSELQTGFNPYPSKNNQTGELIENADGSIDLYFGPEAPEVHPRTKLDPDRSGQRLVSPFSPPSTDPSNRGSTRRGDQVSSNRCERTHSDADRGDRRIRRMAQRRSGRWHPAYFAKRPPKS